MNAGKPYAMRVSTGENPAEWGVTCGKIGATNQDGPGDSLRQQRAGIPGPRRSDEGTD